MLRDFVEMPEMPEPPPQNPPPQEPIPQEELLKLSIPRALWNNGLQRKNAERPVIQREKSTRVRRPNSMLRDFVGNGLNEIIIGGVIHKL